MRSWYFATANNALVEITNSTRRVWLLPNFHRLARGLGAVHCIQKYLERG